MTRIYVGKLSHRCSERDLRRFLDAYGKIKEILMKNGFAFVDFEDYKDADDAVYDLNGKDLNGDRIIVEHAKGKERGGGGQFLDGSRDYGLDRNGGGRGGRYGGGGGGRYGDDRGGARSQNRYGPPMRTKWTVRVENLSSRVSWQDLKDMCRKYGEVTYADAHRMETNVATVCFQTEEDMRAVIRKMDGKDLNGRKVEFIEQQVEKSRSRSRSRGARSRSRTPPRKRSRTRSRTPLRRSNSPASRTPSRSPRGRSPSPRRSRSRSGSRN